VLVVGVGAPCGHRGRARLDHQRWADARD
jgi:hypothetical protein